MTKFSDGWKVIRVRMAVQSGDRCSPDFESDFFNTGSLMRTYGMVHTVDDVDYLIEQAEDWQAGIGDYVDDYEGKPGHRPEDRIVEVDVLADVHEIAKSWIDNADSEVGRISLEQAEEYVSQMDDDWAAALSPKYFADVWNQIIGD